MKGGNGMPRRIVRAEMFEIKTIDAMKSLGVYRPEYDQIIYIYSKLLEQYEELKKEVGLEELQRRTDAVITLENLRKDIAKYSDLLCLNPKVFEKTKIKDVPKKSKLEEALERLG